MVIQLKEPRLGRVKTRLGQDIGMVQALWWYRHQVSWLIRQLNDPRWRLILAISPDDQVLKSRIWPTHLDKIAQGRGNLGTRMGSIFNKLTPGPVCIIGSDIPEIKHHHINHAFQKLGSSDWVFGPSTDGGYWLIGAKRVSSLPRNLFKGVRWSTANSLADTRRTVESNRVAYVESLNDVDHGRDLYR